VETDIESSIGEEVPMLRRLGFRFAGFCALILLHACSSNNAKTTSDAASDAASSGDRAVISSNFSFFVTSEGSSDGGNLGGLVGADKRCQDDAARVGAGAKTWHAYLSLNAGADGTGAVNARERIGTGPWYNVRGVLIASNVGTLHEEGDAGMNNITEATGLDENGNQIPAGDADAGVAPEHDILTGSGADGRALPATPDNTCAGWTSDQAGPALTAPVPDASTGDAGTSVAKSSDAGSTDASGTTTPVARVGHVNRTGSASCPFCSSTTTISPTSWNSAHPTPGCAQTDLVEVGGIGRLYCFAID
jgi:hypothetical protein